MRRPPITGKRLQDDIASLARSRKFHVAHFSPGRVGPKDRWITNYAYDSKGFLDLVLVRERLIMVEIKGDGDTLRAEQELWIEWLTAAGIENHVWGPSEWFDGTVDRILK